ncbi:MAG: hypothetical protein ABFD07_16025, partial [Methanobacterium sp.]
ESTRHPSEPDDNTNVEFRKARIQVIDLEGNPLDEYLFIDWLKRGRVRIVGQYNITQEPRLNPDDTTIQMWVFDEGSLIWTPPPFYVVNGVTVTLDTNSRDAAEAWLQTAAFEVMGYIKLKVSEHQ